MPVRPIIVYDDPLLRTKSRRVRRVTPALRELIDDMFETMREANGIGLAAVQVGAPERLIVLEVPQEKEEKQENEEDEGKTEEQGNAADKDNPRPVERYVVINPEVARQSSEMEEGVEGCLSVPGMAGEVSRHRAVTVKGLNPHGKAVRIKADGMLARVFQHEIDHCDGLLFIDHIDDPEKIWPVKEGEEEAAERDQVVPDRAATSEPPE
jgi:peptide deformylase